jgi:integrase
MLRLGARDGLVARVPHVEMLKESAPRAGFVDDSHYRALASKLREDLQCVVGIAYTYGWRARSEILPMMKSQIDLARGTMRLDPGTTKNKDGRVVYLTPELKTALAAQLKRVGELERATDRIIPYVFPHLDGPHKGDGIVEFRKAWRAACRAAGLPGLLVHDLRRSAVRNMERAGVARSVAMKLTGHKTESVYRRYAIVSDSDLRDASARLSRHSAAR